METLHLEYSGLDNQYDYDCLEMQSMESVLGNTEDQIAHTKEERLAHDILERCFHWSSYLCRVKI